MAVLLFWGERSASVSMSKYGAILPGVAHLARLPARSPQRQPSPASRLFSGIRNTVAGLG